MESQVVNFGAPMAAGQSTFIFNAATGALRYDADGAGGALSVQVVTLQGVTGLSVSDFDIF
jgi:Ca2+-binding RTX toxin-like protein